MVKARSTPTTAPATVAKNKDNLHVKPGVGKCYRYEELGDRSNKCPKRKQFNITNYGDDEGIVIKDATDSDFVEENRDLVACVVQRLLATKSPLTLCSDIKFFIRGVRSKARYAISSLTKRVARILFLEHLWTT